MCHQLERDTEKARQWDKASVLSKHNWDMGTALAFGERDPRPPPTTLLETKLYLETYSDLKNALLGEGSPFSDQVLALQKTMDLPKLFGTCNQWYDHRCRQLIWAVLDEGVTYCGCGLTPDDFFHPKENFPFPMTTLSLEVIELEEGKDMDRWGFPKEWKWDYYQKK